MTKAETQDKMNQMKVCVIVPTYNNHLTVVKIVNEVLEYCKDVIVVNDGSTDDTQQLLENANSGATIVSYPDNRGKGEALRIGFRKAVEMGFDYAITIDSDGQHYASDIPLFVDCLEKQETLKNGVLIVGQRQLPKEKMSAGSVFANKFSNFWFLVQTWQDLKDTQTGYRLYPLHHLYGLGLLTARYEAELELMVFAAWHGVKLVSIPINVYYPPREERVSHFRPGMDFMRITILNIVLCVACVVYGWWAIIFNKIFK